MAVPPIILEIDARRAEQGAARFRRAIDGVKDEARGLVNQSKRLDDNLDQVGRSSSRASNRLKDVRSRSLDSVASSSSNAANRLQRVERAVDRLNRKTGGEFERNLSRTDRTLLGLTRTTNRFTRALSRASRGTRESTARLREQEEAASRVSRTMRGFAAAATVAATAAAAIATQQGIQAFRQYEDVLAEVRAVSGATRTEFEQFSEVTKQLGATTRFSSSQAGESLLFLSRAGFSANESIKALPATLDLALAGTLDLGTAADIVSNALSQFGLSAEETSRAGDILVNTANSSNTSVRQLAEGLKFAGPFAQSLGIELEETAATLGVLGDSGIQASLAGTNLRGILAGLLSPTTKAEAAIQSLGLSVDELSPKTNSLADIFERFRDAGAGPDELVDIFGKLQVSAATALQGTADKVRELNEANQNAEGTSARIAAIIGDTLSGSLFEAAAAAESLALAIGEAGASKAIRAFVDGLTVTIRATKTAVENYGSLLTLLGATAGTTTAVISSYVALNAVIGALSVQSGLATTALAALRGALLSVQRIPMVAALTAIGVALGTVATAFIRSRINATSFGEELLRIAEQIGLIDNAASRLKRLQNEFSEVQRSIANVRESLDEDPDSVSDQRELVELLKTRVEVLEDLSKAQRNFNEQTNETQRQVTQDRLERFRAELESAEDRLQEASDSPVRTPIVEPQLPEQVQQTRVEVETSEASRQVESLQREIDQLSEDNTVSLELESLRSLPTLDVVRDSTVDRLSSVVETLRSGEEPADILASTLQSFEDQLSGLSGETVEAVGNEIDLLQANLDSVDATQLSSTLQDIVGIADGLDVVNQSTLDDLSQMSELLESGDERVNKLVVSLRSAQDQLSSVTGVTDEQSKSLETLSDDIRTFTSNLDSLSSTQAASQLEDLVARLDRAGISAEDAVKISDLEKIQELRDRLDELRAEDVVVNLETRLRDSALTEAEKLVARLQDLGASEDLLRRARETFDELQANRVEEALDQIRSQVEDSPLERRLSRLEDLGATQDQLEEARELLSRSQQAADRVTRPSAVSITDSFTGAGAAFEARQSITSREQEQINLQQDTVEEQRNTTNEVRLLREFLQQQADDRPISNVSV